MSPGPIGVVVEFAGLPGVGKTTLARHTRDGLIRLGVPCRIGDDPISAATPRRLRVLRRLSLATRQALAHPAATVEALGVIHRLTGQWDRDLLAGAVQWLATARLIELGRAEPGVTLLEEGPVQTVWTLALRTDPSGVAARRLLTMAAADVLLVTVSAPLDLVGSRLAVRTSRHSRSQLLEAPERTRELQVGERLLAALVDPARPQHDCVNARGVPPEELGRDAAAWVLRTSG